MLLFLLKSLAKVLPTFPQPIAPGEGLELLAQAFAQGRSQRRQPLQLRLVPARVALAQRPLGKQRLHRNRANRLVANANRNRLVQRQRATHLEIGLQSAAAIELRLYPREGAESWKQ